MSGNSNKLPAVIVTASLGVVIATYWIASRKKNDDVNKLLLDRLEEMQHRLEDIEKDTIEKNTAISSKEIGSRLYAAKSKSNKISAKKHQQQSQQQPQHLLHRDTADSDVNVIPPPLSLDDDDDDDDV